MAKEEKNPFVALSIEQVLKSEKNSFFIQVGSNIFYYDNKCVFSEKSAESFKLEIEEKLVNMLRNGTLKEQGIAMYKLMNLRIHPMRVH